ncbi:MAG TPA: four-carbon acid sugar kinase family protein, partial [Candidatus Limnocylindria bacterium]|nr:four-carbon acid sugar kinase family protein [Candidatus Limnocylindria bacterium]
MPNVAIIADDLTGACDAGIQLAAAGFRTSAFIGPSRLPASFPGDALALSTGTRDLAAPEAAACVRDAARALRALHFEHHYKKVDSLLRGSVFAEAGACMESLGHAYCLLSPAYPDNGRRLVGGEVVVTDAGGTRKIPVDLGGAARFGVRAAHIPLADVARGPEHLAAVIRGRIEGGPIVLLADAAENVHLRAAADAIRLVPAACLPAGSAGLAKHMLPHWPAPAAARTPERVPARPGGRVLVVAGSVHPSALAQLDRMRGAPGFAVFDDAGEAAHAV